MMNFLCSTSCTSTCGNSCSTLTKGAIILLFLQWLCVSLHATHIIGGEMNYEFVRDTVLNGTPSKLYRFTLTIYRDCYNGGAQLDNPARIGIYRGSTTNSTLLTSFNVNNPVRTTVPPIIPPCADKSKVPNACIERGIYTFSSILPLSTTQSYFVVYQRCCRTHQIINIASPEEMGATYMVEITPAAMQANNSSPRFKNYPPGFICNNFFLKFDHSATEADGDSLVYDFCPSLHGGGRGGGGSCNSPAPNPPCGPPFDTLVYINSYTTQMPMQGNPTVKIDVKTGLLSGTPTKIGQYVVAVCVKEYRNGQLLSVTLRDFQFNVLDCVPSVVADILEDELLGDQQFLVRSCGEKNVTIINQSLQSAALNNQFWTFDLGNGQTFTSSSWHVIVPFPAYGQYSGRLILNRDLQCSDTAHITVRVFPAIQADFTYEYDVCTESEVQFRDSSQTDDPNGVIERLWDLGVPGATSKLTHPTFQYPTEGVYTVALTVRDTNNCSSTVKKQVEWRPQVLPKIPPLGQILVCLPDKLSLAPFDPRLADNNTFIWDFGDGSPPFRGIHPQHHYQQEGLYTLSVAVSNPSGCLNTDTFRFVEVRQRPTADFTYAPAVLTHFNNQAQFFNRSDSTGIYFKWQFGNLGNSQAPNPRFIFPDTGLWTIRLTVTNRFGCVDSIAKIIDVIPQIKIFFPNVFQPSSSSGLGNDRFGALGVLDGYSDFLLRIYGRWGELVFETRDPQQGWDGSLGGNGGRTMPAGVYFFMASLTGPRGELLHFDGNVTLID